MSSSLSHIAIEAQNVTIGYPTKRQNFVVATDIQFQLEKGTFAALLGKNGIGKSTLLRTIAGVQKELDGTVVIDNKTLSQLSHLDLAHKISMVLTERLPDSQLTVFELVALGRQPYTNWLDNLSQTDVDKVVRALELTDTKSLQAKRFYELSDGQLQRVLIARALAQDTDIIVLDEPTAHLDMHHTIKIFTLLRDLVHQTGKTVLISSHEVNLSLQMTDTLLLMTSGGFLSGTTQQMIEAEAFDSLFPPDVISFNPELKQFVLQKKN